MVREDGERAWAACGSLAAPPGRRRAGQRPVVGHVSALPSPGIARRPRRPTMATSTCEPQRVPEGVPERALKCVGADVRPLDGHGLGAWVGAGRRVGLVSLVGRIGRVGLVRIPASGWGPLSDAPGALMSRVPMSLPGWHGVGSGAVTPASPAPGTHHVEPSGRLLLGSSYRWAKDEGPGDSGYVSRVDECPSW